MTTPNKVGIEKAAAMTDAARLSERDIGAWYVMRSATPRRSHTVSAAEATAIPMRNAMWLTTVRLTLTMLFILLENVLVLRTANGGR